MPPPTLPKVSREFVLFVLGFTLKHMHRFFLSILSTQVAVYGGFVRQINGWLKNKRKTFRCLGFPTSFQMDEGGEKCTVKMGVGGA